MDENAIRQWLIDCFGPIQGEMAWNQLSNMPEAVRDQLMSQDPSTLPKPEEVKSMMQAFTAGGLNTMGDMQQAVEQGPINIKLAKSLALQQANGAGSDSSVNAETGEIARRAISEANLWLDTACEFNPAQGETQLLTRAGWVEDTIDAWAQFASPVAESMNDALASILSQRFGDGEIQTEISGVFAGPIEIPIPDEMKNPAKLMRFVGNTSFAMQLGRAAGDLSHEVRGSFDQGIALLKNPAGGLIAQNATEYAKMLNGEASAAEADTAGTSTDSVNPFSTSTDASANPIGFTSAGNSDTPATDGTAQVSGSDASADAADAAAFEAALSGFETTEKIPESEVLSFLALQEIAHARLYASVPWLMPRFEALIGKYARGISIDLDAMEEQLRDATSMDPESISGAVNLTKVGIPDTPEQREALAMVEGWVDCVVWRAGMAHLPHIEQLREMMRRERAMGGPAERTFESLLGLQLRPKRMREATGIWEMITAAEGPEGRDAKWTHPDLLPSLPGDKPADGASPSSDAPSGSSSDANGSASHPAADGKTGDIDWDAELSKLLGEDGEDGENGNSEDTQA